MPRHASSCSSVFSALLLALVSSASTGCAQILGIEDLPALAGDGSPQPEPDARIDDARQDDGREPDARPDATPVDAAPPADAPELPPDGVLVSHDLLTRYFIDEANSGSDVFELEDSAPNPLDLDIDYNDGGTFIENAGSRGLRWDNLEEDGAGRASVAVGSDTKIRQRLDGATRATIEVVVDIDQFVPGSRISHIGEGVDRGVFTLRLEEPATVRFVLNNSSQAQDWNVTLVGRQRTVLHLVLDTSQANPGERVRLYVDGVAQPSLELLVPGINESINITSDDHHYVLGNTEEGGRGIAGTIFYAAMYTAALAPDEVAHNAGILLDNDDTPAN